MSVFLSIIIIIVILAVLISIHEAGHLAMAKIFNIYCFEYSIGFGPKLIHVKRKAGETFFSVRAIPFGGYVAMYGETDTVPEGFDAPPIERSIEGVAKWKKALVLFAGVFLNFILGLVLLFVSVSCFPQYYALYGRYVVTPTRDSAPVHLMKSTYDGEVKTYINNNLEPGYTEKDAYAVFPLTTSFGYVFSDDTVLYKEDGSFYNGTLENSRYVALYVPSDLVESRDICLSLTFYPVTRAANEEEKETLIQYSFAHTAKEIEQKGSSPEALATKNVSNGAYFLMKPYVLTADKEELKDKDLYTERFFNHRIDFAPSPVKSVLKDGALVSSGITAPIIKEWNSWPEIWSKFGQSIPNACGAIVKGFISLFQPGGWNNISGIIGMTAQVPGIMKAGGAANVFRFAGIISINLSFFNLLPFPGLDGWGLVVTAFEGITRKKISSKVKGIVSFIGLILLFGLMIAVVIKDIIALIIK